jgi:hypothetical protein
MPERLPALFAARPTAELFTTRLGKENLPLAKPLKIEKRTHRASRRLGKTTTKFSAQQPAAKSA